VERYYDSIAESYDELYGEEQKLKYIEGLKAAGGEVSGVVLDAGCGTALLSKHLKGYVELVGVDISRGMLGKAVAKVSGKPNIHLIRCDVEFLPFPAKVFDACLAFTLLQNLPNPEAVLAELRRVSKPKAFFALTLMEGNPKLPSVKEAAQRLQLILSSKAKIGRETVISGFKA
jgi:ubiquinone/menaquinone biosynthesis C-methylase UbiE